MAAPSGAELVELVLRAQRLPAAEARLLLMEAWRELEGGQHAERCVLSHYLADTEEEPRAELDWDLQALAALRSCSDEALGACAPGASRVSFLASLELNVAQAYEKLGELEPARTHAARAHDAARFLDDSPLGTLTRGAVARLLESLADPSRKKPASSR